MRQERVTIWSGGRRIAGVLHLPGEKTTPFIIASHGLLSSKDSDKYVSLGDKLSREGIALLRFDFRGCGESEGSWEETTVSGRLQDLLSSIRFVRSHRLFGGRIGLLGSSLGGYIALLASNVEKGIEAIAVWSTPFDLKGLESDRVADGIPSLGRAFLEDLPRHSLSAVLPVTSNCLVIHGEKDELVSVDHARKIYDLLGTPKKIEIIEGADHRLSDPVHREKAFELTVGWFKRWLKPGEAIW